MRLMCERAGRFKFVTDQAKRGNPGGLCPPSRSAAGAEPKSSELWTQIKPSCHTVG